MTRSIEVHIDEVILHGTLPQDRQRAVAEIEREIRRQLAATSDRPAVAREPTSGASAIASRVADVVRGSERQ